MCSIKCLTHTSRRTLTIKKNFNRLLKTCIKNDERKMIPIYQPSSIYNDALSRNKQMHNSKKFNFFLWYGIWLQNTLRPCFLAAGDNVLKFNCGSLFLFFGCVNIPFSTVGIFFFKQALTDLRQLFWWREVFCILLPRVFLQIPQLSNFLQNGVFENMYSCIRSVST